MRGETGILYFRGHSTCGHKNVKIHPNTNDLYIFEIAGT